MCQLCSSAIAFDCRSAQAACLSEIASDILHVHSQAGVVGLLKGSQVARFALPAPEAATAASIDVQLPAQAAPMTAPAPPTPITPSSSGSTQTPKPPTASLASAPQSHAETPKGPSQACQQPALPSSLPSSPAAASERQQASAAAAIAAEHDPAADAQSSASPGPLHASPGPLHAPSHEVHRSAQPAQHQEQQRSTGQTGLPAPHRPSDQTEAAVDTQAEHQAAASAHEPGQLPQRAAPAAASEAATEADDKSAIAADPRSSSSAAADQLRHAGEAAETQTASSSLQSDSDAQPEAANKTQLEASENVHDTQPVSLPSEASGGGKPDGADVAAAQKQSVLAAAGTAALTDIDEDTGSDAAGDESQPPDRLDIVLPDSAKSALQDPLVQSSPDEDDADDTGSTQQGASHSLSDSTPKLPAASLSPSQSASPAAGDDSAAAEAEPDQSAQPVSQAVARQQIQQVTQQAAAERLQESAAPSQSPSETGAAGKLASAAVDARSDEAAVPTREEGQSDRKKGSIEPSASTVTADNIAGRLSSAQTGEQKLDQGTTGNESRDGSAGSTASADTAKPGVSMRQAGNDQAPTPLHTSSTHRQGQSRGLRHESRSAELQSTDPGGQSSKKPVNEPKTQQAEAKAVPSPRASAAKTRQTAEMKRQQTSFNPLG